MCSSIDRCLLQAALYAREITEVVKYKFCEIARTFLLLLFKGGIYSQANLKFSGSAVEGHS